MLVWALFQTRHIADISQLEEEVVFSNERNLLENQAVANVRLLAKLVRGRKRGKAVFYWQRTHRNFFRAGTRGAVSPSKRRYATGAAAVTSGLPPTAPRNTLKTSSRIRLLVETNDDRNWVSFAIVTPPHLGIFGFEQLSPAERDHF